MTDLHVKYCRAENGIEITELDSGSEAVVHLRRRNGMTKLEKILLVSTVVFVITSAIFSSLYLSERQHRNSKKETPSSENGAEENCNGREQNQDENTQNKTRGKYENTQNKTRGKYENTKNRTRGKCVTTECTDEVAKQAALGKHDVNFNCALQILIVIFRKGVVGVFICYR